MSHVMTMVAYSGRAARTWPRWRARKAKRGARKGLPHWSAPHTNTRRPRASLSSCMPTARASSVRVNQSAAQSARVAEVPRLHCYTDNP